MKKVGNWLWGLVLVALGVILGLNALNITDIEIFFPGWWTLIIIVPCFIGLFTDEHKWGNFVGLLIGVCLLLGCLGVLSFDLVWKLFFPALLVLIGLTVIFHGTMKSATVKKIRQVREAREEKGETETEEYWATFGGQDLNFKGKEFKGCRLDSVFGGIDLDLRGAKITEDVIVKASTVFGGIVIYVPEDLKVEVVSTSIFGGVSDKKKEMRKGEEDDGKKTLYVDASCVFGGVEIR